MNINYLYAITDLYLKNESGDKKTILNIRKLNDEVEFSFGIKGFNENKTTFTIPYDEYNSRLMDLVNRYKQDLMIIDEKYTSKDNNICEYSIMFNSGRSITFSGFTILEMNNVRNSFYDIRINKDEVRLEVIEEEKPMAYKPRVRLQQAGFSSLSNVLLLTLFFISILVVVILIIKAVSN